MKMRNSAIFSGLILFSLVVAGCNSNDCDTNFSCDTVQPTYGILSVNISTDSENPVVPIAVYVGNIEDSSLYFVDTISQSTDYYVDLDVRYSGSAKYKDGIRTILAIDGDRVNLKTEENCDYTCYTVQDGELNLALKQ